LRLTNLKGSPINIAAFPSACGRRICNADDPNRAGYAKCVGDDIAWIKMGPDGRPYAINPESGFFGVLPALHTLQSGAMDSIKEKSHIKTVPYDAGISWWEGIDARHPICYRRTRE
jgi:phosphoenolpyruvate carboxykinase (GTP)